MRCLYAFRVLNATCKISCNRGFESGAALLARRRTRNVPRAIKYEPGLRHRAAAISENSDCLEEIENEVDLEDDADVMSLEKAYDMDILEEKRQKERLGYIITAKKFFKGPQQPSTLSCNERECIRYLHKADPVQWNVKTLSESFPAMPEAIRKVLKGKFKFSAEIKKRMDLKVQKNWELLAEGKLQAAPEVLEHLKRFINRREVLLDQIKKANFYLPEVKEEVSWNNGEMSNILVHYEKAIQKLVAAEPQGSKMFSDGPQGFSSKIKEQKEICESNVKPEKFILSDTNKKCYIPDRNTEFVFSNEQKKTSCETQARTKALSSPKEKSAIEVSEKKKDFSDTERTKREDHYYANQVKDIENTAFWNKGRTNQEKALAENEKVPLGGPDIFARGKICSSDAYPERIKIPRDKQGSGLTFRVRDCYYDDDEDKSLSSAGNMKRLVVGEILA